MTEQIDTAKAKLPAVQFYTKDWREDLGLQSCSLAAQGLWINALCLMHQATPYGYLMINGKAMSAAQIGRAVGVSEKECAQLLQELDEAGVSSTTDEGAIYNRRMVRDEAHRAELREIGRLNGRKGAEHGKKGAEHGVKGGRPRKLETGAETGAETPPLDTAKTGIGTRATNGAANHLTKPGPEPPQEPGQQPPENPPSSFAFATASPTAKKKGAPLGATTSRARAEPEAELMAEQPVEPEVEPDSEPMAESEVDPPLPAEGSGTRYGLASLAMRQQGMGDAHPGDVRLRQLVDAGVSVEEFEAVASEAVAKRKPFGWALVALVNRRADAAANPVADAPAAPDWRDTRQGVIEHAVSIGLPPFDAVAERLRTGPSWSRYRADVIARDTQHHRRQA